MEIDWARLFVPEASILELLLRGTITYLTLFLYFRFVRRGIGGLGITDILLLVIVADAAQGALGGNEQSITGGLIVVATVAAWDLILDWISWKVPSLRRISRAAPVLLIRDGAILNRNLSREMITAEELRAQLREQGIAGPGEVKAAFLEGDGKLSVLKRDASAS
jgi:uncharacterized membrane protein YcaP (DUF421 family)